VIATNSLSLECGPVPLAGRLCAWSSGTVWSMLCLLADTCVWLDLAKNVNGGPLIASCRGLIDEERLQLLVPQIVIDEFERNRSRSRQT
jgi:hypothetical protein